MQYNTLCIHSCFHQIWQSFEILFCTEFDSSSGTSGRIVRRLLLIVCDVTVILKNNFRTTLSGEWGFLKVGNDFRKQIKQTTAGHFVLMFRRHAVGTRHLVVTHHVHNKWEQSETMHKDVISSRRGESKTVYDKDLCCTVASWQYRTGPSMSKEPALCLKSRWIIDR